MDEKDIKYIIDTLLNSIYDPWTDDSITEETIKKDLEEKPLDIIYSLCARVKELETLWDEF